MSNDAEVRARACLDATRHSPECYMAVPSLMDADDRCDCDREIRAMLAFAAEVRSHDGEWEGIETAPHACHVIAVRFDHDAGEWIYGFVKSPPSKPFTHWRMPPEPPVSAVPLDEGPK